jgi:hypothetical protein
MDHAWIYYQDFQYEDDSIVPSGKALWMLRFTPVVPGQWKVRIEMKVKGKKYQTDAGSFTVSPEQSRGFLRVSKKNPRALEFEDGTPLLAVGENIYPTTNLGKTLRGCLETHTLQISQLCAGAGRSWVAAHYPWK